MAPRLPKRGGGRPTPERAASDLAADLDLCGWLEGRWRANGFAFGSRGWGYVGEGEGIITKAALDAFEIWLARVRKDGLLNPDMVSDDDARQPSHVENLDDDDVDAIAVEAREWAQDRIGRYRPVSVWEGLDTYLEVMVEKIDLKLLFDAACERYGVVLVNGKGSSDINLRRRMLQRFRAQHQAGRRCVLLYFGDLDPPGLRIASVIKQNLLDCAKIQDVCWDPSPIEVVRFGLDAGQVAKLSLPWIDNLITGSGKDLADPRHPDHNKPYVQDYLATHGPRKVEANALAAHPVDAAAIVEAAINRFVPADWPERHQARLAPHRQAAARAFVSLMRHDPEGGQ